MDALNEYLLPGKDDANVDGLGLDSSNSDSCKDESVRGDELHEMLVPATLREPWTYLENPVKLNSYYIEFSPDPNDRIYKNFGLFVKAPLPVEAERMEVDLHLARGRSVMTKLVPSGLAEFDKDEIVLAQNFQEMYLKIILDRSEFIPLGKNDICKSSSSTFYLLLPVILHDHGSTITVDWEIVIRCLSSPVFKTSEDDVVKEHFPLDDHLQLANGCRSISDVENSLVYVQQKKEFFFITNKSDTLTKKQRRFGIQLKYPGQPLLHAKPLFRLHNLLHNRKSEDSESREPEEEYFIDLPPELCQLKIIGFSKDMGSSISLLPSIMHRLENLLVAIQLKHTLSVAFPEGAELTCDRVLEALTTEKCQEGISLERLEILGDAFLKFAVGRHLFLLHDALYEGELTRKRADIVDNANLYSLAIRCNLQVYIRDNPFDPCQFFALGHPCLVICNKETEGNIHSRPSSSQADHASSNVVRCSKGHHWLQKETIADVVEALVGAFIVDSGFNAAISFLRWIGIQVDFEASHVVNACKSSTSYIPLAARMDIAALKNNLLGYQFHHIGLLIQAFVHPSYNNNRGGSYQRLEFLGDAALDYLITSYLYSVYPKLKPGELTDLRSAFVNNKTFANVAVDRSFHKYLISNSSDLTEAINTYVDSIKTRAPEGSLIDGPKYPKALGDLVESCLGAILLDTGFNMDLVWTIALSFLDAIMRSYSLQVSPIREIHELCQAYNLNLRFSASKNGTLYMVEAQVNGTDVCITASAVNLNKKEAMRIASQEIFSKLKAKGYIPKSKTLEEVLKSSYRMEAKLIGYDEKPIDVNTPDAIGFEKLMAQSFSTDSVPQIPPVTKVSDNSISCITPVIKKPFGALRGQPSGTIENHSCDPDSQTAGGSHKGTARSRLHEICVANSWKPSFECCGEEGPSHSKLFSFKVVVEKKEASVVVLVCFGAPRLKKKDAAEDAAEGALWYLKHEGYLPESD